MIFSKQNLPEGFYVYLYLRDDNTPYYCGKGSGIRAWHPHRNKGTTNYIGGIHVPTDNNKIIIVSHRLTESEALSHEIKLIQHHGRKDIGTGILLNRTNGGDGATGRVLSKESRDKIKKSNTGKQRSKSFILKAKNRRHTAATKEKISKIVSDAMTIERKEAIRRQQLNRSPEQKERYRDAHAVRLCCIFCKKITSPQHFGRYHKDCY